jgi:hypothetical protein
MSHRLSQVLPVVRHHVEHQKTSARLENATRFGDYAHRIGHVVEYKEEQCDIDFSIRERKGFQPAISDVDVLQAL